MICTFFQLHILENVPRHKSFSKAHHLNSKTEHWNSHRTVPRACILPDHKHQNKKQISIMIFCELAHPAIFGTAVRYSQVTKGLELPVEGQSMGGREYGMASLAAPGASKAVKQTEPRSLRGASQWPAALFGARGIFGLSEWGVPEIGAPIFAPQIIQHCDYLSILNLCLFLFIYDHLCYCYDSL